TPQGGPGRGDRSAGRGLDRYLRRPVQSLPQPHQKPTTDPADALTHPAWCDPSSCAATSGGPHRGAPALVTGDRIGSALLRLRGGWPSDALDAPVVLFELVAPDRDTSRHLRVDLSVRQLDHLRRVLHAIAGQVNEP